MKLEDDFDGGKRVAELGDAERSVANEKPASSSSSTQPPSDPTPKLKRSAPKLPPNPKASDDEPLAKKPKVQKINAFEFPVSRFDWAIYGGVSTRKY